jgi:putative ABC transport system ATP-binding protein
LANDPPIIVADEPTGNLDTQSAGVVFDIFEDLAARGKTIIMVTHDEALARRASRSLRISDGVIISDEYVDAEFSIDDFVVTPMLLVAEPVA